MVICGAMKAVLTLINTEGQCVDRMEVDRHDWSEFRFPIATCNLGTVRGIQVVFEDGLQSMVMFNVQRTVCMGDILAVTFDNSKTEDEFRAEAIALTGWKPLALPDRLAVMKRIAAEEKPYNNEVYDLQWEALSEGRGGGFCPVPSVSKM